MLLLEVKKKTYVASRTKEDIIKLILSNIMALLVLLKQKLKKD